MADSSKPPPKATSTAMSEATSHPGDSSNLHSPRQNTAAKVQTSIVPMDEGASEGLAEVPVPYGNLAYLTPATSASWLDSSSDNFNSIQPDTNTLGLRPHLGDSQLIDDIFTEGLHGRHSIPNELSPIQPGTNTMGWGILEADQFEKLSAVAHRGYFPRDRPVQQDNLGNDTPGKRPRQSKPNAESGHRDDGAVDIGLAEDAMNVENDDRLQSLLFVCPFFKFEPIRYRKCLFRFTSSKTNYIKQHIRRHHLQPIHCSICGDKFPSKSERNAHLRSNPPCEPRVFNYDGITETQMEQINNIPRSIRPEGRWYRLWDILFPSRCRPVSPYVKDPWDEVLEVHQQMLENHHDPSSARGRHFAMTEMQGAVVEQSPQDNPARRMSGRRDDGAVDVGLAEDAMDVDNDDRLQSLSFACPFFKFEPIRYRGCLFQHTSYKTNYVKQHIRRHHLQPIHCPICGDKFPCESERNDHLRNPLCEPRVFDYDGITMVQREQISNISRNISPEEIWYRLWDILFPSRSRPVSPYVKDPWDEVLEVHQQMLENHHDPSSARGRYFSMTEMQGAVVEQSPQGNPARRMSERPIPRQDAKGYLLYTPAEDSAAEWLPEKAMPAIVTHELRGEGKRPEAADRPPKGASGGSWNEDGGITDPPSPISNGHASEEPPVQNLATPWVPERGDSVSGPEVHGSLLPGVDATTSQQGDASGKDSGYVSMENAGKATESGDDAGSNYSAESILPALRDGYITTFSNRLAQDIDKLPFLSEIPDERLGEWVRLFSLKLHGESSTRVQREASVFIRKKRSNIIGELAGRSLSEPSEPDSDCQSEEPPRPQFRKPQSLVREWVGKLQNPENPEENALSGLQNPEDTNEETLSVVGVGEEPIHLPNLAEYEQFISESRAYRWLLSMIESYFELEAQGENRMASIGDDIRSQLLSHPTLHKVSRAAPPVTVKALFSLDWNPIQFFEEQEYGLLPGEVFNHVVCLTGTFQQAQAMTIAEFLEQTWPLTYEPLQYLLRNGLSPPSSSKYEHTLQNGSTLTFQQNVYSCTVEAVGQVDFVSEIGEQLAWVAATLRLSPVSNGVLACVPKFTIPLAPYVDRRDAMLTLDCRIDFEMTADHDISGHSPGFCWAGLFRNPLLVTNYPIRRRAEVDTGLEMSLSMMAELVCSWQLLRFGERVILKGFCSLLMATAVAKDVVMWHLFYNPTGERISYYDPRLEGVKCGMPQGFALKDLEGRRHIVGWCSNIVEYFGLPDANLAIRETNLPIPSKSIVIEKLYIEGGGPAVVGLMIVLGKREKPVYLTRGTSLSDSLDWVADQPVVFYDVDNQRAWLVDGASALLHLVRASIERDRDRPAYRAKWKFNGQLNGSSAMEVLSDPNNLDTTLYVDYKTRNASGTQVDVVHSFRDRVQDVLRYLEALMDSQVQSATQNGYSIRKSDAIPTKTAVGFNFWDVAKPPKWVYGRAHRLRTPGLGWVHGWVDYIRSIGALIIFGNDFGELIRPRSADGLCPGWRTVPTGAELMCSTIGTLKALQKVNGAGCLGPGELTSGIVWSSRRQLFAPCPCLTPQTFSEASHVDPVQFLLPKNKLGQLDVTQACVRITLDNLGDLGNDGAAVFGHIPYHKTRPRLGYSRSSQEQASSSNGSIGGTSRDTTQEASVIGLPKDDDRTPESRPGNPLKRLWDAFLRT